MLKYYSADGSLASGIICTVVNASLGLRRLFRALDAKEQKVYIRVEIENIRRLPYR